eukprot:GHUV01027240.1.p1 GENE.GHUV01027240.1~~GHUV01027240.1.p1  ORF type:complete len:278 (+),score=113.08 GHUV01027240.1:496-1329(+)
MHGHVVLLAELIKRAKQQVDLDRPNNTGLSIRDILQLKQQQQQQAPPDHQTSSENESTHSGNGSDNSSERGTHACASRGGSHSTEAMPKAAAAAAADAEWRARLAEEWSDDENGWGNTSRGAWGAAAAAGDSHGDGTATGPAAEYADDDDDDVWADRLWKDMQDHRRRHAQEAAAARAATAKQWQGFVGDRDAAAQERQRRAAAAAAESERIIREEQSKDADWRAAMMREVEEVIAVGVGSLLYLFRNCHEGCWSERSGVSLFFSPESCPETWLVLC